MKTVTIEWITFSYQTIEVADDFDPGTPKAWSTWADSQLKDHKPKDLTWEAQSLDVDGEFIDLI